MPAMKGREVLALLQKGQAKVSTDGSTIVSNSGAVLATRIATKQGVHYFEAPGDLSELDVKCVRICLEWEYSENGKVRICVEWGCQE